MLWGLLLSVNCELVVSVPTCTRMFWVYGWLVCLLVSLRHVQECHQWFCVALPTNTHTYPSDQQPWYSLELTASLLRPIGVQTVVINPSVCLSVCLRAYLWNRWTDLHEILCADPLWLWLGPSSVSVLWMTSRLAVIGATPKSGGCTVQQLPRVVWQYGAEVWCLWMLVAMALYEYN